MEDQESKYNKTLTKTDILNTLRLAGVRLPILRTIQEILEKKPNLSIEKQELLNILEKNPTIQDIRTQLETTQSEQESQVTTVTQEIEPIKMQKTAAEIQILRQLQEGKSIRDIFNKISDPKKEEYNRVLQDNLRYKDNCEMFSKIKEGTMIFSILTPNYGFSPKELNGTLLGDTLTDDLEFRRREILRKEFKNTPLTVNDETINIEFYGGDFKKDFFGIPKTELDKLNDIQNKQELIISAMNERIKIAEKQIVKELWKLMNKHRQETTNTNKQQKILKTMYILHLLNNVGNPNELKELESNIDSEWKTKIDGIIASIKSAEYTQDTDKIKKQRKKLLDEAPIKALNYNLTVGASTAEGDSLTDIRTSVTKSLNAARIQLRENKVKQQEGEEITEKVKAYDQETLKERLEKAQKIKEEAIKANTSIKGRYTDSGLERTYQLFVLKENADHNSKNPKDYTMNRSLLYDLRKNRINFRTNDGTENPNYQEFIEYRDIINEIDIYMFYTYEEFTNTDTQIAPGRIHPLKEEFKRQQLAAQAIKALSKEKKMEEHTSELNKKYEISDISNYLQYLIATEHRDRNFSSQTEFYRYLIDSQNSLYVASIDRLQVGVDVLQDNESLVEELLEVKDDPNKFNEKLAKVADNITLAMREFRQSAVETLKEWGINNKNQWRAFLGGDELKIAFNPNNLTVPDRYKDHNLKDNNKDKINLFLLDLKEATGGRLSAVVTTEMMNRVPKEMPKQTNQPPREYQDIKQIDEVFKKLEDNLSMAKKMEYAIDIMLFLIEEQYGLEIKSQIATSLKNINFFNYIVSIDDEILSRTTEERNIFSNNQNGNDLSKLITAQKEGKSDNEQKIIKEWYDKIKNNSESTISNLDPIELYNLVKNKEGKELIGELKQTFIPNLINELSEIDGDLQQQINKHNAHESQKRQNQINALINSRSN